MDRPEARKGLSTMSQRTKRAVATTKLYVFCRSVLLLASESRTFLGGAGVVDPWLAHGFWNAQTCPWTQGLFASRLSSTPGFSRFQIGVVLLLNWLSTKDAEPSLPKDVWLFRKSCFAFYPKF